MKLKEDHVFKDTELDDKLGIDSLCCVTYRDNVNTHCIIWKLDCRVSSSISSITVGSHPICEHINRIIIKETRTNSCNLQNLSHL